MRDGSATRRRIQQEATRLFVAHGIDAVSMRDIAGAVGIRPSALYVHWTSREALVADLFLTGYMGYGRRLRSAVLPGTPPLDTLSALIRLICTFHAEDENLFRFLLLNQHVHLKDVRDEPDNPVAVLREVIAAAAGPSPRIDPELLTAAVIGIVTQPEIFRIYGRIARPYANLADEITALCLNVIRV
jgi:AcrR family transcriptional regulator